MRINNIKEFKKSVLKSKSYETFQKIKDEFKENYKRFNELNEENHHININERSITYFETIKRTMPAGYEVLKYETSIDLNKRGEDYLVSAITRTGKNGNLSWKKEYNLIEIEGKLFSASTAKEFDKNDVKRLIYKGNYKK